VVPPDGLRQILGHRPRLRRKPSARRPRFQALGNVPVISFRNRGQSRTAIVTLPASASGVHAGVGKLGRIAPPGGNESRGSRAATTTPPTARH